MKERKGLRMNKKIDRRERKKELINRMKERKNGQKR